MIAFEKIRPAFLPLLAAASLAVTGCDKQPTISEKQPEPTPAPLFKERLPGLVPTFSKATVGENAHTLLGVLGQAGSPNVHNELAAARNGFYTFVLLKGGEWSKMQFPNEIVGFDHGDSVVRFTNFDAGAELNDAFVLAQRNPADPRLVTANQHISAAFKLRQIEGLREESAKVEHTIEDQREKLNAIIGPVVSVTVGRGQTYSQIIESHLPRSFKKNTPGTTRIAMVRALTEVAADCNPEGFDPAQLRAGEKITIPSLSGLEEFLDKNPKKGLDSVLSQLHILAEALKRKAALGETLSTLANRQ